MIKAYKLSENVIQSVKIVRRSFMALDGIVVASLAKELQENFTNARLSKIAQPEKDELLLTLKGPNGQKRLLLSASASLPLVYIT